MSREGRSIEAEAREHRDPGERERPLPWFVVMLIGAMATCGIIYIAGMHSDLASRYGDSRTITTLMPATVPKAGAAQGAGTAIDGGQLFTAKCAACHQATGLGIPGVFPPLAGSEWVLGSDKVLVQIPLHGVTGALQVKGATYHGTMPPFDTLSDAEVAAVLTYVRSHFTNSVPAVSPATVAAGRAATQSHKAPFNNGDEIKQAGQL
jgi:mono/diheme cytochrome c family protein